MNLGQNPKLFGETKKTQKTKKTQDLQTHGAQGPGSHGSGDYGFFCVLGYFGLLLVILVFVSDFSFTFSAKIAFFG